MPTFDPAALWPQVLALFPPPAGPIDLAVHDYDQSVEVFFATSTPADWLPGETALRAVCALGPATVYCVFADETEFIAGFRADGQWVMSPGRQSTGTPRYGDAVRPAARLLSGEEARLWPEFLAWRATR
jgi:hypothetical protein